ncbi:putative ABC transport system ATP-binding protein [Shimia isoporae]|uniref:Putative ABC transport system ATP-binding protein n=1 Tax=Shimia isoporae TaxID=647720 RepID=A0A4R1NXP9_9RHOB|nr:ABC transporter ATP-binding protein [Shimia isoporae]TCL09962.1 putative ABC transport system ATP-binding protein [Shimia isoporae]
MTVELIDLRYTWPGSSQPVLDIKSFTVNAGERVLLRGPSGCGKSTLLAALSGVIDVPGGCVRIAGQDLGALAGSQRDAFRADHIGLIFQVFNLIPWLSARDNVLLPCRFSSVRRRRLSDAATTTATALLDALGLQDQADSKAGTLSIGQQQRVAAARAMIGAPELVLADEPTSALDPEAKDRFMELLSAEAARTGASLLVVSHDPGLERHFDRTVHMTDINAAVVAR